MKYRFEWDEKEQLTHFGYNDASPKPGWEIIAENEDEDVLIEFCEAFGVLEDMSDPEVPFKTHEIKMLWEFYTILLSTKKQENGKTSSDDL